MSLLYIYMLSVAACVPLQISAAVGSTVLLPCEWRDLSINTPRMEWYIGREVVFERQGKESYQGEGYEGRVDVPEDELLKRNCSLVLRNFSITDEAEYRSSMVIKEIKKSVLVQKVQLSVYKQTEGRIDENSGSSDYSLKNLHYLWILIILPGLVLLGLGVDF